MKNLKKDNKGFSLVELIVVVLIMAIIAVALAPQVIKWVNNSRISADNNTKEAVISAAQNCLSDEAIYKNIKKTGAKDIKLVIDNKELTVTDEDSTGFIAKFNEYASVTLDANGKTTAFKTKQSDYKITITIKGGTAKLDITDNGSGQSDISDK